MKTALEFCKLIDIDKTTAGEIVELENKVNLLLNGEIKKLAKSVLKLDLTVDEYNAVLNKATSYGKEINVHEYKMQLVFALYCFILLENEFEKANIPKHLYNATVVDFKYRVYECQEVYGITGIFVAWWYYCFCNLSLLKFEDFEFEKEVAKYNYQGRHVTICKGDKLLALHIPPKCKLTKENLIKALKASYNYYGFTGKVAYQCHSWLLYPEFENVFVDGGNVKEFRSFFDVFDSTNANSFEDCWRVFKCGEITSLDNLPSTTTLQRNMINHLKNGKKTGEGLGILVFDGENILQ